MLLGFGHSVRDAVAASDAISQSSGFVIRTWLKRLHEGGGIHTLHKLEGTCPGFKLQRLLAARTLRDWDAACAPAYGFSSAEELYQASDAGPILGRVRVPLLFVNADDDPLCPGGRMRGSVYDQPHFARVGTRRGGHLGWLESMPKPGGPALHCPWIANVVEQAVGAVVDWRGESEGVGQGEGSEEGHGGEVGVGEGEAGRAGGGGGATGVTGGEGAGGAENRAGPRAMGRAPRSPRSPWVVRC